MPRRCFIVVPAVLLLRPLDLQWAIRHETQHHRQRDPQFLYIALLGRALFGLNPAMHWLLRQLTDLQELACDEALSGRPGYSQDGYCGCLLRIAEVAAPVSDMPLRSSMSRGARRRLAVRIERLRGGPASFLRTPAVAGVSLLAAALLTGLNALLGLPVSDWRLSRSDAQQLAAHAPDSRDDALVINDAVVRQLNLLLATPDGRAFLRAGIGRMRSYEPSIETALQAHGLPLRLLGVPLVESGYRDLPAHPGAGAGLWMFIAPTARRYGLQVSARQDERLDVQAETGAAAQMFSDLWRQFRDWPLALMAYNSGVSRVAAGIQATHSRDAWVLYRAGYGNDPDYLARITAMMVILEQPRIVD
jgi:hypothetical protein